jgi:hypothetical protein
MLKPSDFTLFSFSIGLTGLLILLNGIMQRRRILECNTIHCTKVGTMAAGTVELRGIAKPYTALIKAPFTGTECVFYRYLVERKDSGENARWVEALKYSSTNLFYFNDDTGRVMVSPGSAEIHLKHPSFIFTSQPSSDGYGEIPASLIDFLDTHGVRYKSSSGKCQLRFTEWVINSSVYLYVIGTAVRYEDFASDRESEMKRLLSELKNSPEQMKGLDVNNDGHLSVTEWDAGVDAIKRKVMQEEYAKGGVAGHEVDFVIKAWNGEEFTISEKSKEDLQRPALMKAATAIALGLVIILAGIGLLCIDCVLFK